MSSIIVTPPIVIAAGAIFPPLCASLVALRFYSRKVANLSYGLDDWLTIPALVLLTGISAAILRGVAEHSVAYPTPAQTVEQQINGTSMQQTSVRKVFFSVQVMQCVTLGCIKLSCMFFYRRIFSGGTKLNIATLSIIGFIIAWTIAFFFTLLFICGRHLDYAWTTIANELKCNNVSGVQDSFAVTDVLTDLIVWIFPLPLVWSLRMSRGRKVAVSLIFLLGALAIMASITRMVIYVSILLVEDSATPPDEDLLSSAGLYFMIIEVGLGPIAACLPSLYGLVASKGLQSIVRSWASALALSDRSHRGRSHRSHDSGPAAEGIASSNMIVNDGRHAKPDQGRTAKATSAKASTDASRDVELGDLRPKHMNDIQPTNTFGTDVESGAELV